MQMQTDGLLVSSTGAAAPPLEYALNTYDRKEGVNSRLVTGKPENLLKAIALNKKGDVMSCGAEYVHDEAGGRGLFKMGTRHSLGYRARATVPTIIKIEVIEPNGNSGTGMLGTTENARAGLIFSEAAEGEYANDDDKGTRPSDS